jgi:hypothetical protein
MKKIILFVSCLIATLANAQSPTFEWAKTMGGYYGYPTGTSNAIDASGNVYTTGYFEGRVDFDPGAGTFYLTAAGSNDIFITKLNSSGNFIWAKQLGGTSDDRGNSIVVNSSGNIIVAGYFNDTADFDPGVAINNLISAGSKDIFISMLDASGNSIWVRQIGNSWEDQATAVAIDAANNIYTTGHFQGNVDFDPGPGIFNLNTGGQVFNVFISKLSPTGNFMLVKQFQGYGYGKSIAIDPSGNIYTTGYFYSTIDFDPGAGTYNLTSAGLEDIFISKLDAAGNFLWAKQLGGSSKDIVNSIKTDASGNVYTIGNFEGTCDFDPGPAIFNLTSVSNSDIFISKLDDSGNYNFAYSFGGAFDDYGNSISLNGSGNIFFTGRFNGTIDFDPGAGVFNLTSSNNSEIFLLKLNSSGQFNWAKVIGGAGTTFGSSTAMDATGNIYTTGCFAEISDFDPGSGIFNLIALGDHFMFTSKLDASGNFVWANSAGAGASTYGLSMTTDVTGNIYTTGYFYGSVDFDPGPGIFTLSTAPTDLSGDVFVTKCNSTGNLIWAKQLGGISYDIARSIAVDASGNVYTSGWFNDTADFDPGTGVFNLISSYDDGELFVSKLNASGNFLWAKKVVGHIHADINSIAVDVSGNIFTAGNYYSGSTQVYINKLDPSGNILWSKIYGGSGLDIATSIATDVSGNIYFTGYFNGTSDFDPGAGINNLTSAGGYDIFVSKLDGSGNFIWAKQSGGAGDDDGDAIYVDASGKVYITGGFNQTADFDPGPGIFNLTSTGWIDVFISKLDNSGNFIWAKEFGGSQHDNVRSIIVDDPGNVYTTGLFIGTVDFDPGTGIFNLTAPGDDVFISKLDASGNFIWAQHFGGTGYFSENICSIKLDGSGNIYTSGSFYETEEFDPGPGISNVTAKGRPDLFIHKMSQCTPPSAAITAGGPTTFCSGGSVVLNAPVAANRSYQWKKGTNLISGATLSSYTAATGGNYRVIVTNSVTGCSKTTGSATVVTVNTLPSATITPQGPTTFCAGGSVVLAANTGTGLTYKWKKGTNYISGATLSNYTATVGGTYKVEVTNSNGCSKLSAGVVVSVPCREGVPIAIGIDFSVYPNPNSGEFTIKFSAKSDSPIQIALTDELGKIVKRFETSDETVVIKELNLANGIYCLTARNKNEVVVKKINIVK